MTLGTFGLCFCGRPRPPMAGHDFPARRAEMKPTLLSTSYASTERKLPVFGHITAQAQPPAGGGIDIMTILLFVMLGVFIFMMFRRNKKTQQQQATLQSQFAPGVEVMTSFGLFGRIVSMDEAENKVVIELSPGNLATVHRQAVTKIVEPAAVSEDATVVPDDASSLTGHDAGRTDAVSPTEGVRTDADNETPEESLKRLNDEGKKDS
jgi:preprotein translocase subunit YajC